MIQSARTYMYGQSPDALSIRVWDEGCIVSSISTLVAMIWLGFASAILRDRSQV